MRGKFLHTIDIKDFKCEGSDVILSVFGIFNTEKVSCKYYTISHIPNNKGGFTLTQDLCPGITVYDSSGTLNNVGRFGKQFDNSEEGLIFIQDFKDKWEFGSNDTRQGNRDKKLDELLDH